MDARGLVETLRRTCSGEIRDDSGTRELYATDASLYRKLPVAALRAGDVGDLEAAVAACREHGVPLTMRGAGTSLAGQTVGPGLIVDCSALRAATVDPDAMTARVEPGVVLDQLNRLAFQHGLGFGPDVATANRATLGGMIANNSAGARSVAYGLTADHVVGLDAVFADGTVATLHRGAGAPPRLSALRSLAVHDTAPRLLRRVSGYNLDALKGAEPDWPRLLCGSEGTLAVTLTATLQLVERPPARGLAVLAYPTIDHALEAVPALLEHGPSAVELMDRSMVDARNRAPATSRLVAFAGDATAMLIVEYQGDDGHVAARLARHSHAIVLSDPAEQAAVWAVRRSGIARAMGLGSRDEKPLAFIEDPAVPPDRLASFARTVRAILDREGIQAVWYGHASVGCLHIRPLIDLRAPGAVAQVRRIAEAVADAVVAHDGSLSGEHGDGRLRGELLPRMYPPDTIAAFATLKRAVDPEGLLNPGVIVDPEPLDTNLRLIASPPLRRSVTAVNFAADGGLARAAEACTNNGACRKDEGPMCPSYQALGDERHSTRGRAVLFRAALEGRIEGGLASDELHEALDLCLACKACKSECPAQVDMSRLKVEALAHRNRTRRPDLTSRMLGASHGLLKAGSRFPAVARLGGAVVSRRLGHAVPIPVREWQPVTTRSTGPRVVLFADTFTRFVNPHVGDAAIRVLEACGAQVTVIAPGCCGRPFLSQGFVAQARTQMGTTIARLAPFARSGVPIVTLEPSCWSMLSDDATTVLDDADTVAVSEAVVTFERAVLDLGPPHFAAVPRTIGAHAHCHTRALGADDLADLLGHVPDLDVRMSTAGCCGMAGGFGVRHPELSRTIATDRLLPEMADMETCVSPGSSCRHQLTDLSTTAAIHPAELLASYLAE